MFALPRPGRWLAIHSAHLVLADGHVFHLGRDDAAAGVVHLRDVLAGLGAAGRADQALRLAAQLRRRSSSRAGRRPPTWGCGRRALGVATGLDPRCSGFPDAGGARRWPRWGFGVGARSCRTPSPLHRWWWMARMGTCMSGGARRGCRSCASRSAACGSGATRSSTAAPVFVQAAQGSLSGAFMRSPRAISGRWPVARVPGCWR